MDPFSPVEDALKWDWGLSPDPPPPPPPPSSFSEYKGLDGEPSSSPNHENIHRRLTAFVKAIPASRPFSGHRHGNSSRSFRQMMRERMRRERLSQGFADLHSMLPNASKATKNAVVESAVAYLKEQRAYEDELIKRNKELIDQLMAIGKDENSNKIRVHVRDPSVAIDSMIEAFNCLKTTGVKARSVVAEFSGREPVVAIGVDDDDAKVCREDVMDFVIGAPCDSNRGKQV